jgi:hypothetical protein
MIVCPPSSWASPPLPEGNRDDNHAPHSSALALSLPPSAPPPARTATSIKPSIPQPYSPHEAPRPRSGAGRSWPRPPSLVAAGIVPPWSRTTTSIAWTEAVIEHRVPCTRYVLWSTATSPVPDACVRFRGTVALALASPQLASSQHSPATASQLRPAKTLKPWLGNHGRPKP